MLCNRAVPFQLLQKKRQSFNTVYIFQRPVSNASRYDTFTTDSSNPFDGNFSIREGSNLEATLDLQEVGTALLRPNSNETASATPLPLPMLFSEYGGGMKIQPLSYNIAHDWWVMRGKRNKKNHWFCCWAKLICKLLSLQLLFLSCLFFKRIHQHTIPFANSSVSTCVNTLTWSLMLHH